LLYGGDLDTALERLGQARAIIKSAALRQEYVAPVAPWYATALRMQAEGIPLLAPAARRAALRRAARAARAACRLARWYRNNQPHALRERGLVAALRGRTAAADRCLQASAEAAIAKGARYEAALTERARAR